MARILIGIPCYQNVSPETLEDYMRFAFYCGRELPQHKFFIGIKTKTEQFRARNMIVESALQTRCDYLLFLDDDHVIDWENIPGPTSRFAMIDQFLKHMEADPTIGIVGAVYYHRGNQCRPVLMKEGKDGGFYWMRDDEITGELQEVAVQGGGCMFLRMSAFDRIKSPWFEPETTAGLGTDLQISRKMREAGFKVCCDTSLQIGHVIAKREVVTPQNRHRIAMENARQLAGGDEGINDQWKSNSALNLYTMDVEEYLGVNYAEMANLANQYTMDDLPPSVTALRDYYATRGKQQLARQVMFHHLQRMQQEMQLIHSMVNTNAPAQGLDFGCGSAPVSFELALRGHAMDFVDIDGAAAYEFTKWRANKRHIADRCGWKLKGPYDYVLMLDSIEHIPNWEEVLASIIPCMKEKGALITNYFLNNDYANPEHVSMDKKAVRTFLTQHGIYPINQYLWVKHDLGFMDKPRSVANV